MHIHVRLLTGYQQSLWYKVPQDWDSSHLIGSIVRVPLQKRTVSAIVENIIEQKPDVPFAIRPAYSCEPYPDDTHYFSFIQQLAQYYQVDYMHFIKRMRQFIAKKEVKERAAATQEIKKEKQNITLTQDQQNVVDYVSPFLQKSAYKPTLLHGVTGSGKTEVYKALIKETIAQGKTVLLLLPEVTLAVQFTRLLQQQLPQEIEILTFHSATSVKQKRALWKAIVEGKPVLIIGVHLPVLLPIANLGLIIVDEEHEVGYQEKKHPKVNTKDVAIWRAQAYDIPILLGSATPSIATLYNQKEKSWALFTLKKRFAGSFPKVTVVALNDKMQRRQFWISTKLEKAIKERLEKKEQTIIFLNRRGFSFFVQCKICSFTFKCTNCSVSLTLHQNGLLTCHYCDYKITLPEHCPDCKKEKKNFMKKGVGTQQVVSILEKQFPHAHIARADLDTTVNKKRWQETMQQFEQGQIDILVGTQTITKGYDFPHVTLVGILWADLNLHFPIYNASETTLQQLIQVAGRAGRKKEGAEVIVQTMMKEHPIFDYINEVDYTRFYGNEIKKRLLIGYPPALRLVEIELKHTQEDIVEQEAHLIAKALQSEIEQKRYDIRLLGPAQPPVSKVKNWHMRKMYLKAKSIKHIIQAYKKIDHMQYASSIFFTPNPLT